MRNDLFITLLLAIVLVVSVTILNERKTKQEETYFFVDTPIKLYSSSMSSVKGFPFVIKCNDNQIVAVEITSGTLQDEHGILTDYKNICNKTIYWNEKEIVWNVTITFQSDDDLLQKQQFILHKNEKKEFYLSE